MTHTTHSDNLEDRMSELTIKDNLALEIACLFFGYNHAKDYWKSALAKQHPKALEQAQQLIDSAITEAQIRGIEEAHKEILERAYTYTGEDELSDFCGVDDLSRVAMSWKVDRIKELKNNTTKQEDIKDE